jgi:hypothetical protein
MKRVFFFWSLLGAVISQPLQAQHSVARLWNEELLHAISKDLARPPIQARNLFHISAAMYDAWAVYRPEAQTYFLGKEVNGFYTPYNYTPPPSDIKKAQEEAISFAAYRLIEHRFLNSPDVANLFPRIDWLMDSLGYNRFNTSVNYKAGAAEMGNYIAAQIIEYGLQDGSNESVNYKNQYYQPVNPPLQMSVPGNRTILDMNRWQPVQLAVYVDQSGNVLSGGPPPFQSPEWGNVAPFAMNPDQSELLTRDGHHYRVYHRPPPPALIDTSISSEATRQYQWNHALVAVWSSLLDPKDSVFIDISPASLGNNDVSDYPADLSELPDFFDLTGGRDRSHGHSLNPKTGLPYVPELVPRGDYTRVLAEFWADGPTSETPPGHWFSMLNYANDHPQSSRRVRGVGPSCDNLEWDVKSYFALGGAMHDAAVTAWGIKGWYDSSRPVSAIRAMAELGQSSDPALPSYHPGGLPLIPGYIELIGPDDPLKGPLYLNEIKVRTWKGPYYIGNPQTSTAGVAWIRAKDWWPYQRPTFVTPPFAGYISGHSTYSRAAAEVLTELTGDAYFPGGVGTFFCEKNKFLVFEEGPSVDVTLQWATYRDAADQCSLSRIYGGIHPPMDDIPGRLIGMTVGKEAFEYATSYFEGKQAPLPADSFRVFPNPTPSAVQIEVPDAGEIHVSVFSTDGKLVKEEELTLQAGRAILDLSTLPRGAYQLTLLDDKNSLPRQSTIIRY